MKSRRSLNRVLRDSLGKGLTKEEVKILALENMRLLNSNFDKNLVDAFMTEAQLLQWATATSKVEGVFDDNHIMSHDMKYR